MSLKYLGRGCKTCPVREHGHCDTATYRGSRCAELRDAVGLDDPEEVTPVNYTYRGVRCTGAQYSVSPTHFFFEKDGKGFEFEYEPKDEFFPVDDLEYAEKAIDAFLEQEARKETTAELQKQLEQYKSVFGDILFPAKPGTQAFMQRREIQENPAGEWMYSYDGLKWKTVPQDTGKIDFLRAMLRRIPDGVVVGVTADVKSSPNQYEYSTDNGNTWRDLCSDDVWIFHGSHDTIWFRKFQRGDAR